MGTLGRKRRPEGQGRADILIPLGAAHYRAFDGVGEQDPGAVPLRDQVVPTFDARNQCKESLRDGVQPDEALVNRALAETYASLLVVPAEDLPVVMDLLSRDDEFGAILLKSINFWTSTDLHVNHKWQKIRGVIDGLPASAKRVASVVPSGQSRLGRSLD